MLNKRFTSIDTSVNVPSILGNSQKENLMNKFFKIFSFVAVVVMLVTAFGVQAAPTRLPYGLTVQDTMAGVEQKLGQPQVVFAPQAGWESGLPDEGGSPDHLHYWAVYKRFGITIIYNTPSLFDKNATIYDIVVNE